MKAGNFSRPFLLFQNGKLCCGFHGSEQGILGRSVGERIQTAAGLVLELLEVLENLQGNRRSPDSADQFPLFSGFVEGLQNLLFF
jgi:hypothetical protein